MQYMVSECPHSASLIENCIGQHGIHFELTLTHGSITNTVENHTKHVALGDILLYQPKKYDLK